MTAKSAGSNPARIPGPRAAHAYQKPVLSGETIYNGALTALDPVTGKWVEAISTNTGQIVYGWARLGDVDSFSGTAAAALSPVPEMLVDSGCNLVTFASVAQTDEGKIAYVTDDQTGTLTPGAPILGVVQLYVDSTHAYVSVDPLVNIALAQAALLGGGPAFKCRAVATSIGANTGTTTGTLTVTATGALGAQDGVTMVAGDYLFIQEGTSNVAAADAGPWQVSVIGATGVSAVLVRPSWWQHGAPIVPGATIEIGDEGTGTNPVLASTTWKTHVAKAKLVDTDAPLFWPRKITCAVTLASGTLASARTTMPVRSHLKTDFIITSDPATAPHATTRLWRVSALTAGVTGTASVQMVAESAPGTTNTSDVGQYNLTAINW